MHGAIMTSRSPARVWVRSLFALSVVVAAPAQALCTEKRKTMSEGAVTQQPRSKKRELEEFVRDLDPTQVSG